MIKAVLQYKKHSNDKNWNGIQPDQLPQLF